MSRLPAVYTASSVKIAPAFQTASSIRYSFSAFAVSVFGDVIGV